MSKICRLALKQIRKMPAFRGRNGAIKALLSFVDEAESFYGPSLTVRRGDNTFYASYFARYGYELVNLLEGLPHDGVFLEFGANTGIFSLIAANQLSDGHVFAIEPNPLVFRDLVNNVRINNFRNIVALNLSIGQHTELVPFNFDTAHTGKGHLISSDEVANAHITLIQAEEFIKLLPDISDRAVMCKIDTEGSELFILQALRACGLIKNINKFYIEIDERYLAKWGHQPAEIYDLMCACGFEPETDRQGQQHYDEIFQKVK